MRYKLLLLICLGSIDAAAQQFIETVDFVMLAQKNQLKVKEHSVYSFKVRDGRAMPDSQLKYHTTYNKEGKPKKTIIYDSTGNKHWSHIYAYRYDKKGNLIASVSRSYRYDSYSSGKRKLHRKDITLSKPEDKHYYNNSSFEQKSGAATFTDGKLTTLTILIRYLYGKDTGFHLCNKLYFSNGLMYRKDYYRHDIDKLVRINYFIYDGARNVIKTTMYELPDTTKPKAETHFYYDSTGLLYTIESDAFDRHYYDNPHAVVGIQDEPAHYSTHIKYNEKRVAVEKRLSRNGILIEKSVYRYKFY